MSLSGSGTSYTATVTSPTAAKGTITLEVGADSVTDGTRTGPASKATSSAMSFDATVAAVSFTEPQNTSGVDTFNVGITFSKDITGFEASDITLTTTHTQGSGDATFTLSGSDSDYTAAITVPNNASGTITLEVAANAATDGHRTSPKTAQSTNAISFRTTTPVISQPVLSDPINTPPVNTNPTTLSFSEPSGMQYANTFDVGITFSKSVTGFAVGDITVATTHTSGSGDASVTLSGSGTDYIATVTSPIKAVGSVTLTIAADAANDGANDVPASAQSSASINFDTTVPTVVITVPTDKQPDGTMIVPITFSKQIMGFETDDITLTTICTDGTGDATGTLQGGGATYTATITPPADTACSVELTLKANTVTDGTRYGPAEATSTGAITFGTDTQTTDTVSTEPTVPTFGDIIFNEIHNTTSEPTVPTFGDIIFNEIHNTTSDTDDWIELKNIGTESIMLEGWSIGIVTGTGKTVKETQIATLPEYVLPPDGFLLILNTAPGETPIAPGLNILTGEWDATAFENGSFVNYLVSEKLALPPGDYFLTLRPGTPAEIVDSVSTYWPTHPTDDMLMWPLEIEKPAGTAPVLAADVAWGRIEPESLGYLTEAWAVSRYQVNRGYDEEAPATSRRGTPGYPNFYWKTVEIPGGPVAISEIMATQPDSRRPMPQWIELYNTAEETVDLTGWQLALEMQIGLTPLLNHMGTLTFEDVRVLPKQTLLLVTREGANSGHFPAHKVYDLSTHALEIPDNEQGYPFSSTGFCLTLSDATGEVIDKVGNLDGDPETLDAPAWTLPAGKTIEGYRSSLIRRYEDGTARPGTEVSGWWDAASLRLSLRTHYGHETDIGNPGYRKGGYLPVTLSHFSAALTETGVTLTWTTESELNNAGFNVWRAETPTGTFKRVNPTLIEGSGTTSERQKYVWQDTTAEPNVAYYYRLEDVSLSGVHQQLTTVRMRDQVSAAGKRLGTWASLKMEE